MPSIQNQAAAGGGNAITMAANAIANTTVTSTISISGGTTSLTGHIAKGAVSAGTSLAILNLSGGTLEMNGNNVDNLNTFAFTGGTFRNVGTLNRALAQTAASSASLFDVLANNSTINGTYSITGTGSNVASANIAATRSLTVSGAVTVGGVGAGPSQLTVNGALNAATGTTVAQNGTVSGAGAIAGPLTLQSDSALAPGNSTGVLSTGNLSIAAGSTFVVEASGTTTAGVDYDQVVVNGTVTIAGGNIDLSLIGGYAPSYVSPMIVTLISNDSTDAIAGTLFDTIEGQPLSGASGVYSATDGTYVYTLTYTGDFTAGVTNATPGSGNDLVLTVVPEPAGLALLAMAGLGLLGRRRRRR